MSLNLRSRRWLFQGFILTYPNGTWNTKKLTYRMDPNEVFCLHFHRIQANVFEKNFHQYSPSLLWFRQAFGLEILKWNQSELIFLLCRSVLAVWKRKSSCCSELGCWSNWFQKIFYSRFLDLLNFWKTMVFTKVGANEMLKERINSFFSFLWMENSFQRTLYN